MLAAYIKESLAASDQVNFTHNKIYVNLHSVNYLLVLTCLLKTGGVLHEEEKVMTTICFLLSFDLAPSHERKKLYRTDIRCCVAQWLARCWPLGRPIVRIFAMGTLGGLCDEEKWRSPPYNSALQREVTPIYKKATKTYWVFLQYNNPAMQPGTSLCTVQ